MQNTCQIIEYGPYLLTRRLAAGGMAEVFRARTFGSDGFEKMFAIKRLHPHLCTDNSFVEMFIDEAKLVANLNHTNIVPIHSFGREDGQYYIGMEYVRGCTLAELILQCRRCKQQLPMDLAIWLLVELCNGLDYAHRKHDDLGTFLNLIHRDINPQNILLSYEGEVKITDFGIAKARIHSRDETTRGVLKGKYSYMSPEQVRGERLDHRSDLFSFGVVAWELLTYHKMFDGKTGYQILEKIRNVSFSAPSRINPAIPEEVEHIVLKALSQNPQQRYSSVADMRLALLRFLGKSGFFPSRAHLSAFLRQLFQEKQLEEKQQIREETKAARQIQKETIERKSRELEESEQEAIAAESLFIESFEATAAPPSQAFILDSIGSFDEVTPTSRSILPIVPDQEMAPSSSQLSMQSLIPAASHMAPAAEIAPHIPAPLHSSTILEIPVQSESSISQQAVQQSSIAEQLMSDIAPSEKQPEPSNPITNEQSKPLNAFISEPDKGMLVSEASSQTLLAPVIVRSNKKEFSQSLPLAPSLNSQMASNIQPFQSNSLPYAPQSFTPQQQDSSIQEASERKSHSQSLGSVEELPQFNDFTNKKLIPYLVTLILLLTAAFLYILWSDSQPKQPFSVQEKSTQSTPDPSKQQKKSSQPKGQGILSIRTGSGHWAYVYLDGILTSSTPFHRKLPAGKYKIELHFPSKQKATKIQKFEVVLRAGEKKQLFVKSSR